MKYTLPERNALMHQIEEHYIKTDGTCPVLFNKTTAELLSINNKLLAPKTCDKCGECSC